MGRAMGAPGPEATINWGDHQEIVRPSDNPTDVSPIDQIVVKDANEREVFIRLFPGMSAGALRCKVKDADLESPICMWLHCSEAKYQEYKELCLQAWPSDQGMRELPSTEQGRHRIQGIMTFRVNDHYFRAVAKIAFHYYLCHTRRGYRGDEKCFEILRQFIMEGGDVDTFFRKGKSKFRMPYGDFRGRGRVGLAGWQHCLAASEMGQEIYVRIDMFVGSGNVPDGHHLILAESDARIELLRPAWGHVYTYYEAGRSVEHAGYVQEAEISRVQ